MLLFYLRRKSLKKSIIKRTSGNFETIAYVIYVRAFNVSCTLLHRITHGAIYGNYAVTVRWFSVVSISSGVFRWETKSGRSTIYGTRGSRHKGCSNNATLCCLTWIIFHASSPIKSSTWTVRPQTIQPREDDVQLSSLLR